MRRLRKNRREILRRENPSFTYRENMQGRDVTPIGQRRNILKGGLAALAFGSLFGLVGRTNYPEKSLAFGEIPAAQPAEVRDYVVDEDLGLIELTPEVLKGNYGNLEGVVDSGELIVSDRMVEAIKKFEGFVPVAKPCPAGKLTNGYGNVVDKGEKLVVTREEAEIQLRENLRDKERAVREYVRVPLTQGQYDALVSFTFNLGEGALRDSTLLKYLNDGKYEEAAKEFPRWNKATVKGEKVVLNGLVERRAEEKKLFESGYD